MRIFKFYLAINGVKNNENYIEYDEDEATLKMVNEGSFKVENMLMGASSRRGNTQALGQFGEGMKLFFMILLKMIGILNLKLDLLLIRISQFTRHMIF